MRFHKPDVPKSCPGTAIDYAAFVREGEAVHSGRRGAAGGDPGGRALIEPEGLDELLEAVGREVLADDPGEAETAGSE